MRSNQGWNASRLETYVLWLCGIVSMILFFALLVWLFGLARDTLLQPDYLKELLWLRLDRGPKGSGEIGDKAAAAQFWGAVFGGCLAGGLTMVAAFIALGGALIQLRKESNKEFLEWVMGFNRSFHEDVDYREVRVAYAQNRLLLFKTLMIEEVRSEFNQPGAARGDNYLNKWHKLWTHCEELSVAMPIPLDGTPESVTSPGFRTSAGTFSFNWSFIRKITDFLRFYEMLLTVAQRLPKAGGQRETLLGAFAWQIRAVLWNWPEQDSYRCSRRLLALYYLCQNRFENLAAAGYFFALQQQAALEKELLKSETDADRKSIQDAIVEIREHLEPIRDIYKQKNAIHLPSDEELRLYWEGVLGNKGFVGF